MVRSLKVLIGTYEYTYWLDSHSITSRKLLCRARRARYLFLSMSFFSYSILTMPVIRLEIIRQSCFMATQMFKIQEETRPAVSASVVVHPLLWRSSSLNVRRIRLKIEGGIMLDQDSRLFSMVVSMSMSRSRTW